MVGPRHGEEPFATKPSSFLPSGPKLDGFAALAMTTREQSAPLFPRRGEQPFATKPSSFVRGVKLDCFAQEGSQ